MPFRASDLRGCATSEAAPLLARRLWGRGARGTEPAGVTGLGRRGRGRCQRPDGAGGDALPKPQRSAGTQLRRHPGSQRGRGRGSLRRQPRSRGRETAPASRLPARSPR